MNVSGPLLMLLLTAWTVSSEEPLGSVWQFKNMISCVQPGVDPLRYIDYGCYCGPGGQGTPVDDLDRCCKVHDECYDACEKIHKCKDFDHPYYIVYDYTCSKDQATCSETNNKCQKAACECDRAAALCFARTKYIPEHEHLDQKHCKK